MLRRGFPRSAVGPAPPLRGFTTGHPDRDSRGAPLVRRSGRASSASNVARRRRRHCGPGVRGANGMVLAMRGRSITKAPAAADAAARAASAAARRRRPAATAITTAATATPAASTVAVYPAGVMGE